MENYGFSENLGFQGCDAGMILGVTIVWSLTLRNTSYSDNKLIFYDPGDGQISTTDKVVLQFWI